MDRSVAEFTPERFARRGPREIQALLPASAVALIAMQRPSEHCRHFHGRGREKKMAVSGYVGHGQARLWARSPSFCKGCVIHGLGLSRVSGQW